MHRTKPMGMLLQDPSVPELHTDYEFPLDTDCLMGTGSSKLTLRDSDLYDMPLYPGLDWENADLSFATLNKNGDFIDNPQFHQVNAFAVAAHALSLVETAIGREMKWKHGGPLIIRPHAFQEANAFYDPMAPSLNFGSFTSPFRRAPIWTCLSHDIVVHELGHAILDSFRPLYIHSEEADTAALHESVSDLMALFAALSHRAVVERIYAESGGDMFSPNLISGLAEEFGIGLQGVGFPYLRSALEGKHYDEAPWGPHDRSTTWTAAIYEILARLVAAAIPEEVQETLQNAPAAKQAPAAPHLQQQTQQRTPEFEAYYSKPAVRSSFTAFYDAIMVASKRVQGMMLRALQDLPPTGLTFLTLARVLYNADARLFPDDPQPREVAKEVFQQRGLWREEISLNAPGIGPEFEEAAFAGNAALMCLLHRHAEALRIPLSEGARILNPRLSTITRTLDAGNEQRGTGSKTLTERYLYYTYELLQDGCFFTPDGGFAFGKITVYKGGTLVMDENWNDIQLATDPDYWVYGEADTGEDAYDSNGKPVPAGVRAVRMAKHRFIKTYRHSLRAFRDGLVRPDGTLPSGQPALPFRVVRQSSGANLLVRHTCHFRDQLNHLLGKPQGFPFKVD